MAGDAYHILLEGTLRHLEDLKSQGIKYVPVSKSLLDALSQAPTRTTTAPARPLTRTATAAPQHPGAQTPAKLPSEPLPTQPLPSTGVAPAPTAFLPASTAATSFLGPALSSAEKLAAIQELNARMLQCTRCAHLASSRRSVVVGVGSVDARILFVGEAPGADEDAQGEPFVGKAGELLTKIIVAMGLSRQSVFIANVLKCRPDTPGQSTGNRKPTPAEMGTCLPYLLEQIRIVRPAAMVALGATAIEGLLNQPNASVSRLRGRWLDFHGIPLMPTYHPAYLLRNDLISEKRKVWEDMLAVMERIGMPISPKQRGYFLKPA